MTPDTVKDIAYWSIVVIGVIVVASVLLMMIRFFFRSLSPMISTIRPSTVESPPKQFPIIVSSRVGIDNAKLISQPEPIMINGTMTMPSMHDAMITDKPSIEEGTVREFPHTRMS